MRLKLTVTALSFAALAMPAGDPAGVMLWKSAELKAFTKSLSPKIDALKVATQSLGAHGNYSFLMAHREGSGQAEWHDTQADVMVIESGQGTLVVGGELVNAKTTAPNEKRAASISGGTEKKVAPGDIITVPIKTPHQMKVDPGKEITYFVVKITQ
jgi:mannose-6-phosphate isomerase-like protein (cupin superfamily)